MWTSVIVLISRIRAVLTGARIDADLRQEIESHLDMLADEHVSRGMTPEEARRQARLRFGGAAQLHESQRDQRGFPFIETALRDIRYALRVLRRNPGFAAVAVLSLGIGIGANTAIFSIVRAVLLRPLPYAEPDRLVRIFEQNPIKRWDRNVVAPANYADWRKQNSVFTDVAAYSGTNSRDETQIRLFVTGNGEPQRLNGLSISGNLFSVLGAAPLLGRTFTEEETYEGKNRIVILSYGLWQSLFGGDPLVVGRSIQLSGRAYDVVGVMPREFAFPGRDVQLWIPFAYKPSIFVEARRPHWLNVVARLKPGVTIERARDEMTAIAARLERTYPDTNTKMGVQLEGFHDSLSVASRWSLLMLLGAVGLMFVIVCVNLANLQLGRAVGRVREMTIRQALGASRGRLVGQLLTEGLTLSMLGGVLGLAIAWASRAVLARVAPSALPVYADLRLDRMVLAFDVALSMLAPVVFGLLPAITSARADALNDRSDSGSRRGRSTRDVLVACEVALSVVLVVGAGLLIRSLIDLNRVDPGFRPDHTIAFGVSLPGVRYGDDPKAIAAIDELEKRVRALPGVSSVGASSTLALRGFLWSGDSTVEGRGGNDYERELRHDSVTPEYFRAIGTPLVRGRFLDARDRPPSPPVTLVNEALAKKYFRGADPVGKRIKFGRPTDSEAKAPWVTIVGIVADQKQDGLDALVQPEAYEPFPQNTQNDMTFAVRTPLDTESIVAGIRSAVRSFDKDLALVDVTTLDHVVTASTGDQRFRTWLLAAFAGMALFLAGLGIYGVLAYFVTQRARELGIRLALGASPVRLFQMVIRQGMAPVAAGSAAGLAGAYAATGLMRSLLYGVQPLDPGTYALAAAVLAAVALVACAVPAVRATRVDPLIALREE